MPGQDLAVVENGLHVRGALHRSLRGEAVGRRTARELSCDGVRLLVAVGNTPGDGSYMSREPPYVRCGLFVLGEDAGCHHSHLASGVVGDYLCESLSTVRASSPPHRARAIAASSACSTLVAWRLHALTVVPSAARITTATKCCGLSGI